MSEVISVNLESLCFCNEMVYIHAKYFYGQAGVKTDKLSPC